MRFHHIHFETIDSTMESARREASGHDFLLITAESQTHGRGTKGRAWQSPRGNIYFTVAVHRKFLPPERLQLFPLEAGLSVWETVVESLPPADRLNFRLKWPNDLLWKHRKTAGMLVETSGDHIFIGVGINISEAPEVKDGGTPSACLIEAGADPDCGLWLAEGFVENVQERLSMTETPDVASEWKAKALWDVSFRLRDRPDQPRVTPLDVNSDGHLRVRFEDGHEEFLVSEYLI